MLLSPPEMTDSRGIARPLDTALAAVMTRVGIDPELEEAELQEALHLTVELLEIRFAQAHSDEIGPRSSEVVLDE